MLKILDKIKIYSNYTTYEGIVTGFENINGINKVIFIYSENGFQGTMLPESVEKIGTLIHSSKYMSKLLRHDSEDLNISTNGYVNINDLLIKLKITRSELNTIVYLDDKQRYSITGDYIRASQGHSIKNLVLEMKQVLDQNLILYHGTSKENYNLIIADKKLKSMKREFVHLTNDIESAKKTGLRKAKKESDLIILKILVKELINKNIEVFISDNNIYQVKEIPLNCITKNIN